MNVRITDVADFYGILGVILLIASVWLIAEYLLSSFSVYTVAKRRGIPNPVTAWVPILRYRTLGAVCDHYEDARGIKRNWRTVLFTLAIVTAACVLVLYIVCFVRIAGMALSERVAAYDAALLTPGEFVSAFGGAIALLAAAGIAAAGLSACRIICLFKFFESCRPKDAVKFLLLSILVPFAYPFCMLRSRNYDLGLPQAGK